MRYQEGGFLDKHGDLIFKAAVAIGTVVLSVIVSFVGYDWRLKSVESEVRDVKVEVNAMRNEVSRMSGIMEEHTRQTSRTSASAVQFDH